MAYEDTIRVADLKVRAARFERVRDEVKVKDGQVLTVTEFMHPRLQEVAESLPGWLGRRVMGSAWLDRALSKGRHVETTSLRWFIALRLVAMGRGWRRSTLRYAQEQGRIEAWLDRAQKAAETDLALATEIIRAQRLIKGYGDTFERSLERFAAIMAQADAGTGADALRAAREGLLKAA